MKENHSTFLMVASTFVLLFTVRTALGHVTVAPRYSTPGQELTYTIRVPAERQSPTIRIEADFPSGVMIIEFEPKEGWTVEPKKDPGKPVLCA